MVYSKQELSELLITEVFENSNLEIFEKIIHDDYGATDLFESSTLKWSQVKSSWPDTVSSQGQLTHKDRFRLLIKNASVDLSIFKWEIIDYLENQTGSVIFYRLELRPIDEDIVKTTTLMIDGGYKVTGVIQNFSFDGVHRLRFKENKIVGIHYVWDTLSQYNGMGIVTLNKDPYKIFSEYYENIKASGLLN